MRNFTEAVVVATEAFKGDYRIALAWARRQQAELNKEGVTHKAYTIEGEEDGEGIVQLHTGSFGGVPPYQPIVHKSGPINATSAA